MFWDFGSLYLLTRCRGSRNFRQSLRRLRLCVAAHASRTSRSDVSATPDVEASRITSCRGRRALYTERLCGIIVCPQSAAQTMGFSRWFRCVRLSLEKLPRRQRPSRSSFKVALPPLCCRGNLCSFFMTLFTGRRRHHSSSLVEGRGVSVVMLKDRQGPIYLSSDSGAA